MVTRKTREPVVAQVHRQTARSVVRETGARERQFDMTAVTEALRPDRVIEFIDSGQDFVRWYLAPNGVVVCSEPYQTQVWAGAIVLNPVKGTAPFIITPGGGTMPLKYQIRAIHKLRGKKV